MNEIWMNCLFKYEISIFSQTTSVTRVGGPGGLLKVRVEIDKLGDLKLKISDLFGGRKVIGNIDLVLLLVLFERKSFELEFFVLLQRLPLIF